MIVSDIVGKIYYITKKPNNDVVCLYNYAKNISEYGSNTFYVGEKYLVDNDETNYTYVTVDVI